MILFPPQCIDELIVSTEDREIAEVALSYGASVPFYRPSSLAEDNSQAIDVYIYTIDKWNEINKSNVNEFIVLLPTSFTSL